jgi:hypothetical protein
MKKYSIYIDKDGVVWAAVESEVVLTKIEVEAESLEEALLKHDPKIFIKEKAAAPELINQGE